jgi:hypothetical protein
MPEHKRIRPKDLKAAALEDTKRLHRLAFCPSCLTVLVDPVCSSSHGETEGEEGSRTDRRMCASCEIVWEVIFSNWNNTGGDGGIRNQYHTVSLRGYFHCFCRGSVIDAFPAIIQIHCGDNHSSVNSICNG